MNFKKIKDFFMSRFLWVGLYTGFFGISCSVTNFEDPTDIVITPLSTNTDTQHKLTLSSNEFTYNIPAGQTNKYWMMYGNKNDSFETRKKKIAIFVIYIKDDDPLDGTKITERLGWIFDKWQPYSFWGMRNMSQYANLIDVYIKKRSNFSSELLNKGDELFNSCWKELANDRDYHAIRIEYREAHIAYELDSVGLPFSSGAGIHIRIEYREVHIAYELASVGLPFSSGALSYVSSSLDSGPGYVHTFIHEVIGHGVAYLYDTYPIEYDLGATSVMDIFKDPKYGIARTKEEAISHWQHVFWV